VSETLVEVISGTVCEGQALTREENANDRKKSHAASCWRLDIPISSVGLRMDDSCLRIQWACALQNNLLVADHFFLL